MFEFNMTLLNLFLLWVIWIYMVICFMRGASHTNNEDKHK